MEEYVHICGAALTIKYDITPVVLQHYHAIFLDRPVLNITPHVWPPLGYTGKRIVFLWAL